VELDLGWNRTQSQAASASQLPQENAENPRLLV